MLKIIKHINLAFKASYRCWTSLFIQIQISHQLDSTPPRKRPADLRLLRSQGMHLDGDGVSGEAALIGEKWLNVSRLSRSVQ